MRSRVVVEFDTTESDERKIVNKLGAALMRILRNNGGYVVSIHKEVIEQPYPKFSERD